MHKAVDCLMAPLVGTMRVCVRNFGWIHVDRISDRFANGDTAATARSLRSARNSADQRGPLSRSGNANNPWATQDTEGMTHPINARPSASSTAPTPPATQCC